MARLKDVCRQLAQYGLNITPESYQEAGVRLLRTSDVREQGQLNPEGVYLAERDVPAKYRLGAGDVLFSRSGTVGRCFLYDPLRHGRCTFAGFLVRFRLAPGVDPRAIAYWSQSTPFQAAVASDAIESTILNFNAERYANLQLPEKLAGMSRAIADYLDSETGRIDSHLAALHRLAELTEERRQALISRIVQTGQRTRVRHVIGLCTSGPRGWGDLVTDSGSKFIRSANLKPSSITIDESEMAFVQPPPSPEADRSRAHTGDVLVGITGANTGWVGLVADTADGAYVSQHVAILRPNGVAPEWLAYAITSDSVPSALFASQYGGTKTQLGLDDLREIEIHVPPSTEQHMLLSQLERFDSAARGATETIVRAIGVLVERRQAVITAVVTGQIEIPGVAA